MEQDPNKYYQAEGGEHSDTHQMLLDSEGSEKENSAPQPPFFGNFLLPPQRHSEPTQVFPENVFPPREPQRESQGIIWGETTPGEPEKDQGGTHPTQGKVEPPKSTQIFPKAPTQTPKRRSLSGSVAHGLGNTPPSSSSSSPFDTESRDGNARPRPSRRVRQDPCAGVVRELSRITDALQGEMREVQTRVQRALDQPNPLCVQGFASVNTELVSVGMSIAGHTRALYDLGERITRVERRPTQAIPPSDPDQRAGTFVREEIVALTAMVDRLDTVEQGMNEQRTHFESRLDAITNQLEEQQEYLLDSVAGQLEGQHQFVRGLLDERVGENFIRKVVGMIHTNTDRVDTPGRPRKESVPDRSANLVVAEPSQAL